MSSNFLALRGRFGIVWLALGLGLLAPSATAQESSDCLVCHGDPGLTTERRGRTVSLFVKESAFSGSVHSELGCVSCHADLAGKEFPHEVTPGEVRCGTCHSDIEELHAKSLHGKAIARDCLWMETRKCFGMRSSVF